MKKIGMGLLTVCSMVYGELSQDSAPQINQIADKNVFGQWQGRMRSASVESGPFIDLSFLYLKSEIEGLTFGQTLDVDVAASPGGTIFVTDRPKEVDFSWDPGLSLGIGYIIPQREQWQVSGYWTYLHSSADKRIDLGTQASQTNNIAPAWLPLILGSVADRAAADWDLNFNLMDIALSRNTFLGRWLSFEPRVGIRVAWINQDYTVKYHSGFVNRNTVTGATDVLFRDTKFTASQDYWGAGVRAGSNLQWYLTKNFSLLGSFFASLLYGEFDLKELYDGAITVDFGAGPDLLSEVIDLKRKHNSLRPALETEIGLRWHRFFKEDSYRALIGIFYQFNLWFDQNEFIKQFIARDSVPLNGTTNTSDNLITNLNPNGDLQMQGLRVEARFDF